MADVLWICATGNHPVGIVKIYDEIEERWKYYIGTGDGKDPAADVQMILAKGQKSYSLDHILGFLEEDAVKVVRCKDCKHYKSYGPGMDGFESFGKCLYISMDVDMPVNGYCCYGERKSDT